MTRRVRQDLRPLVPDIPTLVPGQDHGLEGDPVGRRSGLDPHRVPDRAAAELEHDIVAQIGQQLMHLAGMDAARGDRHHLAQASPVLLEVDAALQVHRIVLFAQDVVEALDHVWVALQLADDGTGVDVVDARQPHPF